MTTRAYVTQFVTATPTSQRIEGQHATVVLAKQPSGEYVVLVQRNAYRSAKTDAGSFTKTGIPSISKIYSTFNEARAQYISSVKTVARENISGGTTKFKTVRALHDTVDIEVSGSYIGKNILISVHGVLNEEQPKQSSFLLTKLGQYDSIVEEAFNGAGKATISSGLNGKSKKAAVKTITQKFFTDVEKKVKRPNGEQYFPREVMGHTDVSLLRKFRTSNIPVRLAGAPGTGKTALVEATFNDAITMSGHGDMTVAHFVGTYLPKEGGGWDWADGPLIRAMKQGKPLFVDEGTRIPTEVLNILFSVMDGRNVLRIDDRPDLPIVEGAEGFYVIMGYNPNTLGARPLDEALTSRFRVQIDVTTDYTTAKRIGVPDVAIRIAKNLQTRDEQDRKNEGPGVWVPQMRELITYRDLLNLGTGEEFALSTLLAACPRAIDIPAVQAAIKDVAKKHITLPTLGRSV